MFLVCLLLLLHLWAEEVESPLHTLLSTPGGDGNGQTDSRSAVEFHRRGLRRRNIPLQQVRNLYCDAPHSLHVHLLRKQTGSMLRFPGQVNRPSEGAVFHGAQESMAPGSMG